MEQEKVQKKFDLTTHKRNAKGQIIEVNPYTLYIENGERKFERPPKSGWFYSESGQLLSKPKGAEGDRYVAPVVEEFAQEDLLAEIEALKAAKLHLKLLPSYDLLFVENNPAGVKAVLAVTGVIQNYLRLPLVPLSDKLYRKLEKLIGLPGLQLKDF